MGMLKTLQAPEVVLQHELHGGALLTVWVQDTTVMMRCSAPEGAGSDWNTPPLVLHWGVKKPGRDSWKVPRDKYRPPGEVNDQGYEALIPAFCNMFTSATVFFVRYLQITASNVLLADLRSPVRSPVSSEQRNIVCPFEVVSNARHFDPMMQERRSTSAGRCGRPSLQRTPARPTAVTTC